MHTYTLRFEDDGLGEPKVIEFKGEDPQQTFLILGREAEQRRVSLYDGPKFLGKITRTGPDSWTLD